ncbi:FecR family protein [Aquimarina sp. 2201CG5-10]|uniref:FecR family protein n=1 Tax=Aquimarina callyspongiae TaxID=3098150 RepID=UPI002AB38B1B|nr:FecR family protein [Aquimarina sp. 2201CG5-10]MDY8136442.1 FecR family protein [Aquimarina sp. 2201CG5-10]
MENPYSDETFLARWLNNDLSLQEKDAFEKSEDYTKYVTIKDTIDKLSPPVYNKEEMLNDIQENLQKRDKVISFIPRWVYGAVASIALLLGVFYFVDSSVKYTTGYGEVATIELPDGSEVKMNAISKLSYKELDWKNNRKLKLEGEAFFKVEKGSRFTVVTETGEVQVLGTQFNVNTQPGYFEITCHEGKVKVIGANDEEAILNAGDAFRIADKKIENWKIESSTPGWLLGETTFTNTPLNQVIKSLENQFEIKIDKEHIDDHQRFTGSFTHENLELALKTIFVPMEISYTFSDENNIVLAKE